MTTILSVDVEGATLSMTHVETSLTTAICVLWGRGTTESAESKDNSLAGDLLAIFVHNNYR